MGVIVYTDGACRGNPGPGGCAAIIDDGKATTELARGYRWTTNNRMEILSVIAALEMVATGAPVRLVSDSQYVLNTLSKGWISGWKRKGWINTAREPVKNRDLWEQLDELAARHPLSCHWVRGHATHPLNNRCDEMAVGAALGGTLAVDSGYEACHPYPAGAKLAPAKSALPGIGTGQATFPGFL